jgi:hypothetical protein
LQPIKSTDLFADAVGQQEIANSAMRSNYPQRDSAWSKFMPELMQQARAGQIDVR